MFEAKSLVFSRRAALRGAVVSVLYMSTATPTPELTSSPPDVRRPVSFVASELVTVKSFDDEWTQEVVSAFPRKVAITGDGAAFVCELHWDSRLFDVSPVVHASTDAIVEVDSVIDTAGAMKVSVPSGASMLFFDVKPLNLYPAENIGAQVPTRVNLVGGNSTAEVPLMITKCQPWALELEADWTTLGGVMLPATVRLVSKGPYAAPAGVAATITSPNVTGRRVESSSAEVEVIQKTAGDVFTIAAQLPQGLAAKATATVSFPEVISDSVPDQLQQGMSGAIVDAPRSTIGMRFTDKAGAFPIVSSGVPVSTFVGIEPA